MRLIDSLSVYDVGITTTTSPPDPYDPSLSPVRIFYIIFGTILFFVVAVGLMKNIQYIYKHRSSISREFRYQIWPMIWECCLGVYSIFANIYGEVKAWLTPSLRRTYRSTIQEYDDLDFQRSIHYKERKYDYLDDEETSMMRHGSISSSHGSENSDNTNNSVHGTTFSSVIGNPMGHVYSPINKLAGNEDMDDDTAIELTTSALHNKDLRDER